MTYYVSIGNSDNKLSQEDWAMFQGALLRTLQIMANQIHGVWYSAPTTIFQNMCICFDVHAQESLDKIKNELRILATQYCQESIALAKAETEFIKGA